MKTVLQQQRQNYKGSNSSIDKQKGSKYEAELKSDMKRREKLFQLKNLKVEVMDIRSEKCRTLKWLLRRQKIKQDEDESPTQILNNSKYFTNGNIEDDNDGDKVVTKMTKKHRAMMSRNYLINQSQMS